MIEEFSFEDSPIVPQKNIPVKAAICITVPPLPFPLLHGARPRQPLAHPLSLHLRLLFGLDRRKQGSLLSPIGLHMSFNLLSRFASYRSSMGIHLPQIESFGRPTSEFREATTKTSLPSFPMNIFMSSPTAWEGTRQVSLPRGGFPSLRQHRESLRKNPHPSLRDGKLHLFEAISQANHWMYTSSRSNPHSAVWNDPLPPLDLGKTAPLRPPWRQPHHPHPGPENPRG